MSLLDTKIELQAVEYDIKRDLFPPFEGTTLYFLKEDGTIVNYRLTDRHPGLTTGWYSESSRYQQTRTVFIAVTEADFYKIIVGSSHVAIGETVFRITDGSATMPSEKYPYFSVAIEATGETFIA